MFRKLTFFIFLLAFSLTACAESAVQTRVVRARDIAFDITTLEVQANRPVELTYINEGHIDHAFSINGLLERQTVAPGETRVFSFTPTQTGQYQFVCLIPGHEMAGMVGTLTVITQEK
jgi:uncharacterized cupredoxin-like copper-binding protein